MLRSTVKPDSDSSIPPLNSGDLATLKRAFRRKCARRELLIWARGAPFLSAVTGAMEADWKEADGHKVIDDVSSDPNSSNPLLRIVQINNIPKENRDCPICTDNYDMSEFESMPTQLPCGHIMCAGCLYTWQTRPGENMERTRTEQRQCPMCRAVFCHGMNNLTHFAKERERLAYGMITGLKVPTDFVKQYAEDFMELAERMQDLGFNLSEPDFKNLENVKKDRENKLEGGKKLADIPHSGNAVVFPEIDEHNFWNCYVSASKLPTGHVGFYLFNLLASSDWRSDFSKQYNCPELFGPDSAATTKIAEFFEKRLGLEYQGKGKIGRRTRELLSTFVDWESAPKKSALDGVERLNLRGTRMLPDGTCEFREASPTEGAEEGWEDVSSESDE